MNPGDTTPPLPATAGDRQAADSGVEALLLKLDLSQAQVATLLGLSPQAVSRGLQTEREDYLAEGRRAQRLYETLVAIGGARYERAAEELRRYARDRGWGNFEAATADLVPAEEVYSRTEEIWIVSDSPGNVVDWELLKSRILQGLNGDRYLVVVFFLRTLEAAERWAEVLEREFARAGISDGQLDPDRASTASAYIYMVVTNALTYTQDFVMVDAGSKCIDAVGTLRVPTVYHWTGRSYARTTTPNGSFLRLARQLELGASTVKGNFFPLGIPLRPDVFDFKHIFIDGLIAIRGGTFEDDASPAGDRMAGGLLANVSTNRAPNAIAFNKRAKFTPIFILVYKRRPGEGLNRNRSLRVFQDELDRARDQTNGTESKSSGSSSFW